MTSTNEPATPPLPGGAAPSDAQPETPAPDVALPDTTPSPEGAAYAEPVRAAETAAASPTDDDFASLFAASEAEQPTQQRAKTGDVVHGRVVALGPTTAFVAIGAKSEAVIDLAEFRDAETGELGIAIGDQLTATITDDGSRSGSIVLKRTLGRGGHIPGELEQAREHGIAVEGLVTGQNKGGFDVQVAGVRAFCPASQIDLRRADPAQYVGQRLQFRVTQINAGGRNVVVSRRQLLEEEAATQAASTWERLAVGSVVRGRVTSLRDFGAFVDLGGVEGLIHVTELGHGHVRQPGDLLTVGQEVEAQVVKLEPAASGGRGRIGLSLRALAPDPWSSVADRFPVGASVRGTVRRLEPFGAFVELEPGLDGLVHVSRMSLERVAHPKNVVKVGDEVEVTVVAIEADKRRIALSMVEGARRARDQADHAAKREERETIAAKTSEGKSLGTFADLLSRSPKSSS